MSIIIYVLILTELTALYVLSGDDIDDAGLVLTDTIKGSEDEEHFDDATQSQIARSGPGSDACLSESQETPNSKVSLWTQISKCSV